jgi:hypothetical protein
VQTSSSWNKRGVMSADEAGIFVKERQFCYTTRLGECLNEAGNDRTF